MWLAAVAAARVIENAAGGPAIGCRPTGASSQLKAGGYLTPSSASMMPPEMAVPNTPARLGPMAW